nr:hypothetical protein [Chloroflexota bacterium]
KQIRIEGDNGGEEVTINLGNGGFAPGYGDEAGDTDEIEFILLMGQGWDRLDIEGTAGADEIAFGSKPGAWVPTPAINLNGDGDHDVLYQSADFVIAWGYGGNDTLTGNDPSTGTAFLPIRLTGGSGNDMLTGGSAADVLWGDGGNDTLKGGKGNDKLYTKDGVEGNDSANGGAGTDTCISDPEDFVSAC